MLAPRLVAAVLCTALDTLAASGVAVLAFAGVDTTISTGLLAVDGFAAFFKLLFLLAAVHHGLLMSASYLAGRGLPGG